jgi:hypothetical protein
MSEHLRSVPQDGGEPRSSSAEELGWWDEADEGLDDGPIPRPAWWRWIAIALIVALVVATPLAYAISILLR